MLCCLEYRRQFFSPHALANVIRIILLSLALSFTAGCAAAEKGLDTLSPPMTVSPIPTVLEEVTPIPTAEPSPEKPTKRLTDTVEPTLTIEVPVFLSTPIPTPEGIIDPGGIVELARYEWDSNEWEPIPGDFEREEFGSEVAFSSSNPFLLAAGSRNGTLRLFRLDEGSYDEVEVFPDVRITDIEFDTRDEYLYITSTNRSVKRWSLSGGSLFRDLLPTPTPLPGRPLSMDVYGSFVALGFDNGAIALLDLNLNLLSHYEKAHFSDASGPAIVRDVVYSSDGEYILSGGADNSGHLWDGSDGILSGSDRLWTWKPSVTSGKGVVTSVAVVGSGKDSLFVIGILGGTVEVYEFGQLKPTFEWRIGEIGSDVWSVAFTEEDLILAVGTEDGKVRLFSLSSGILLDSIEVFGRGGIEDPDATSRINSIAFSADGKLLAVGHSIGISIFGTLR